MNEKRSWAFLLPKLWRTLFAPRETVKYPFEPLTLPDAFRGRVVMDTDLCLGCGICVRDCPALALQIERVDKQRFRIRYKPAQCAYCGQCEISCHRGAIHLTNAFNPATNEIESLVETLIDRME